MSNQQPEVTLKNTKDVIFGAYKDALATIAQLKSNQHNPVADAQVKKNEAVIKSAEVVRELTIGEVVAKLKSNVGTILNEVAAGIEGKIEELNVIDQAIALKQAELKDIHGIEVQANSLAALVNASQSLKAQHEADHKAAVVAANAQLEAIRAEIKAAKDADAKEQRERQLQFDQEKKRAQAEWDYDFKRSKQQQKDALADELAAERKEFEEEVATSRKELDEREEAVEERETAVDHAEEELASLKEKVAEIPTLISSAEKAAYDKGVKDTEKVTAIRIDAKEKELALKEAGLNAKNESLQTQLDAANKKNDELQGKLDAAYKDIRQMGVEMVSSKHAEAAYAKMGSNQPSSK